MIVLSSTVLNVLNEDTLRAIQTDLIKHVEALRADDIRPARGQVVAITEINDELNRRERRKVELFEIDLERQLSEGHITLGEYTTRKIEGK
jgi:hypothetical protein